jgi:serine/threonine protein phosphatase PrpC
MYEAKNTQRALVRIGYDGRVYKTFRGPKCEERFENEIRVLKHLERKRCTFVPRLLETNRETLQIVTSNCGARVEQMSQSRIDELFHELESYGVKHDDPFMRNITYRATDGRFCIIDFEFATILPEGGENPASSVPASAADRPQLPHSLRWSGMTHPGRFRPNNEDSFLAVLVNQLGVQYLGKQGDSILGDTEFVFAVSDGMGGERSGELASRIAMEKITTQLPKQFHHSLDRFHTYGNEILGGLFESIHAAMTQLGKFDPHCYNMGATLSLGIFKGNGLFFGHIGDSRIYHLPMEGPMRQVTEDHTHVGWLRRSGQINEREARSHPRKNVLSQALGAGHRYLHPHVGIVEVQPGDRVVFCTDGVNEGLWDRGIEELVRNPSSNAANQSPAQRLVMEAVIESGRDNATAVVVELS